MYDFYVCACVLYVSEVSEKKTLGTSGTRARVPNLKCADDARVLRSRFLGLGGRAPRLGLGAQGRQLATLDPVLLHQIFGFSSQRRFGLLFRGERCLDYR